jgi:uncharacterized Rmd1/YagE family protein
MDDHVLVWLVRRREACDHMVKMAISHALAQSCKLKLYEARVADLVSQVRGWAASVELCK